MITINPQHNTVTVEEAGRTTTYDLGSPEAFAILSKLWLRSGWDNRYVYSFSWLGRPIIQLPDDLLRLQEVIYRVQPDLIIETGVAHGGGLIFYATLCKALGKGRVIGIDLEIRPHNRTAIEAHLLAPYITLIEGDSVGEPVLSQLRSLIKPGEVVMVLLDSCHTRDHVLAELEAYSPLVAKDSYLVAMDGIMKDLVGAPRSKPDWDWNNPCMAVREFVQKHPEFVVEEPGFLFNEGAIEKREATYWPEAFLRRIR
jgi:cephalosporin hydroxylase